MGCGRQRRRRRRVAVVGGTVSILSDRFETQVPGMTAPAVTSEWGKRRAVDDGDVGEGSVGRPCRLRRSAVPLRP